MAGNYWQEEKKENTMSQDFIFSPNSKANYKSSESTTDFYTLIGNQEFTDSEGKPRSNNENKNVLAKCVHGNKDRYYIKISPQGRIYNPIGMFTEGKSNDFISTSGRNAFGFKEVSQHVFSLYINFLATKNLAWLNNAEREMI